MEELERIAIALERIAMALDPTFDPTLQICKNAEAELASLTKDSEPFDWGD